MKLIAAIVEGARGEAVDLVRRDVASLGPPVEKPEREGQDEGPVRGFSFTLRNLDQSVGGHDVVEQ